MGVVVIGLSHKTAPVAVRERLALGADKIPALLAEVCAGRVAGAVALATCNRAEVVASVDAADAIGDVVAALAKHHRLAADEVEPYLYVLRDRDAVVHTFRVAASLDSMIVGEPQILGQFKQAFALAQRAGATDSTLHLLFTQAIGAAKRVRHETGIGENAVSIPYAAIELAKKIYGSLSGLRVMLIGAGKMGVITSKYLAAAGPQRILVANRTFERAVEMAESLHATPLRLEEVPQFLPECDIVICSTDAEGFVLTRAHFEAGRRPRRGRPVFLVDIAVPRNVDPEVAGVEGVYLYNIDDLAGVAEVNRRERSERALVAEEMLGREADQFFAVMRGRQAVPTIVDLRQRTEFIRREEMERFRARLGGLTPAQMEGVEQLTLALVNKILHQPLTHLKEVTREEDGSLETIKRLFGLK